MKVEPFDSPPRTVQRQEAVKPDSAPQPEAKPAEQGLGFISPVIHVDSQAGVAILQYRDNATGDVTVQIPSEQVVQRYRQGEVVAHQGQQPSSPEQKSTTATGGETSAAPAPAPSTQGEGGSSGGGSTGSSGGGGGESAKG
jgi:hypothetical protein